MGRRSRSALQSTVLRGLFIASVLLACGARTGLDYDVAAGTGTDIDAGNVLDATGKTDADDNPVGCQDGRFSLNRASPAVMFVLDRSQSMRERTNSGQTRWTILTESLAATLPPVDTTMEIGALIYPINTGGAQSCVVANDVDFSPGFGNVSRITDLLLATSPRGSTPTADAIDRAASALLGFRAATRARAMVLATDGQPTCNNALDGRTCDCVDGRCTGHPEGCLDDQRTVDRLAGYRDQGLPTYVIGIQDEDEPTLVNVLDRMAVAGGRPQTSAAHSFYSGASVEQLSSAFATIRDEVGACTYLTTSVPGQNGTIVVSVDGVPIAEGTEWSWSNRANGEILFAASTCPRAAGRVLTVDVQCNAPTVRDAGPTNRDAGPIFDASIRD